MKEKERERKKKREYRKMSLPTISSNSDIERRMDRPTTVVGVIG